MSQFDRSEILPPDPDPDPELDEIGLEVLHDREYRVRAFRKGSNLLIRGAVRDQKPPGLYFPNDAEPLTIHHMQVELEVAFPSLQIIRAQVLFEMHPHDTCPSITTHYEKLVGLSIARGFTHKVRELFGGPRGCTHTTALLQAMAPVAIQCFWSMTASEAKKAGNVVFTPRSLTAEQREAQWRQNLNTCHVWAEDGEMVDIIQNGGSIPPPLFAQRRADSLGLDPDEFFKRASGQSSA